MVSIIKTAIITIIISFISGLLLEYYKNVAPRILCNIGRGKLLKLNNKRICTYILTVKNLSNKTIHDINVNVQGIQNDLKIGDAKITKGLKFESSSKDNILDVDIPFLSKDDEFSVTLYVENQNGDYNKPVVTIRSPENFKEVGSIVKCGFLSVLFNKHKNSNKRTINKQKIETFNGMEKPIKNKKAMAMVLVGVLVVTIGILGKFCLEEISASTQPQSVKVDSQKQSTDVTKSDSGTTKNTETKKPTNSTTKSAGTKTQNGETTKRTTEKTATDGTIENKDIKKSSETNETAKTQTSETAQNKDTKTTSDGTSENKNAELVKNSNREEKKEPSSPNQDVDINKVTDRATENTQMKSPISEKTAD